jgi:GNAT superfamily N-acetyltransferase
MRLEPASRYSYAELAEIFTAAYEGYFTPFVLDEAAFRFMSTRYDDELEASRVAVVDGEPAGICKLGIRGERGWIGGVGVALPHRGKGIGEALMRAVIAEARSRALRELWLEVLFPNEPAIAPGRRRSSVRAYRSAGARIVKTESFEHLPPRPIPAPRKKSSTVSFPRFSRATVSTVSSTSSGG